MNAHRVIFNIIIGTLLISLIAITGMLAFRLGRQNAPEPTAAAVIPPTATRTPDSPLPLVTNTPTVTPTPSPTPGPTYTPTATPTHTPLPSPTPIIFDINELGRLETTEFAIRTVVDLENDPSNLWQKVFGTDKLLLIAEGEVIAGFDLQKVDHQKDVHVQGDSVKITLPPPEILYSRIDNKNTYVYERKTGLFIPPDPTLEGRARLLAEQNIVEWAEQRGIYQKAETTGRAYLENFLRSLGFTKITIEVKKKGL